MSESDFKEEGMDTLFRFLMPSTDTESDDTQGLPQVNTSDLTNVTYLTSGGRADIYSAQLAGKKVSTLIWRRPSLISHLFRLLALIYSSGSDQSYQE